MPQRPPIRQALARLLPAAGSYRRVRRYRPLVAGPAILWRAAHAATWTVAVESGRHLQPRAPRDPDGVERIVEDLVGRGFTCRLGVAVAGPLDAPGRGPAGDGDGESPTAPPRIRLDFYGWALMYQPPGMVGTAVIDGDDRFIDLPAVFELPLELIDRAEFLEARGFRTRSLVIPTRPEDFAPGPDGRRRNRFFPGASCRRPCSLDHLL